MDKKLNLGAAKDIRSYADGWLNCDLARGPGIDVSFDANKIWPFESNYFEMIYASHVLEHLWNLKLVMREAHRVLKVGGVFEIRVPFGPPATSVNDELEHIKFFYVTSLKPYYTGNDGNTSLDYDWEDPLFQLESCEVFRVFWQRERLGKILGSWIEKSYTRPRLGIKTEIKWILRKV
jgi:SAM-dependent methyltransferase